VVKEIRPLSGSGLRDAVVTRGDDVRVPFVRPGSKASSVCVRTVWIGPLTTYPRAMLQLDLLSLNEL
jgi:hypothetical protein